MVAAKTHSIQQNKSASGSPNDIFPHMWKGKDPKEDEILKWDKNNLQGNEREVREPGCTLQYG